MGAVFVSLGRAFPLDFGGRLGCLVRHVVSAFRVP
jgi:hypothetical protein